MTVPGQRAASPPAPVDGGLRCDWDVNSGRPKVQLLLLLFRTAAALSARSGRLSRRAGAAVRVVYGVYSEMLCGLELPIVVQVGPRLRIPHTNGIVVHSDCVIGRDVTLGHGCTLGVRAADRPGVPVLGDRVMICLGAAVLGDVLVGDDACVGANSVVLTDVGPGEVVVPAPAQALERARPRRLDRAG